MKKLIIFCMLFLCVGCTRIANSETPQTRGVSMENVVLVNGVSNPRYQLVEITVNKETHEYLRCFSARGGRSLSHWEGCKYCKSSKE